MSSCLIWGTSTLPQGQVMEKQCGVMLCTSRRIYSRQNPNDSLGSGCSRTSRILPSAPTKRQRKKLPSRSNKDVSVGPVGNQTQQCLRFILVCFFICIGGDIGTCKRFQTMNCFEVNVCKYDVHVMVELLLSSVLQCDKWHAWLTSQSAF